MNIRKNLWFLLSGVLFISGCSTQPKQDVSIVWHRAQHKDHALRLCMKQYPGLLKSSVDPNGCFWWSESRCHVVSIDTLDGLRTLGHEVKHCFDGLWHNHNGKAVQGAFKGTP